MIITSNLMLVLLLQWEVEGSLKSTPTEERLRLTPPLPERVKWSTGNPCTAISGATECWMTVSNNPGKKQCRSTHQEFIDNDINSILGEDYSKWDLIIKWQEKNKNHQQLSSFALLKISLRHVYRGKKARKTQHETWTWMVNDCCDSQSGLGRLNAMRMLKSSMPLSHNTSNFSFLPKRLGCLMESLTKQKRKQETNVSKIANFSF